MSSFPTGCDLIAASWLLSRQRPAADAEPCPLPLVTRIRAAAEAGFTGIGLNYTDMMASVREHGHAAIRAMLDDHGVAHLELEPLMDWWTQDESGAVWRRPLDDMLEAAQRLGARQIKATGDFSGAGVPVDLMKDAFAALAESARSAGTLVGLEIVAFSNIADVPTARAVVAGTAGQGGGIMLDCWHFARGNIDLASLGGLKSSDITGVEISNVAADIVGSLFEDTVDHRLMPDAGVYDVAAFLRAIAATGYNGPVGCEVLSAAARELPLESALQSCVDAARKVCNNAGAPATA